jgi:hypothetical protein
MRRVLAGVCRTPCSSCCHGAVCCCLPCPFQTTADLSRVRSWCTAKSYLRVSRACLVSLAMPASIFTCDLFRYLHRIMMPDHLQRMPRKLHMSCEAAYVSDKGSR